MTVLEPRTTPEAHPKADGLFYVWPDGRARYLNLFEVVRLFFGGQPKP